MGRLEAAALAGRVAETTGRPITIAGQRVRVWASIGIAPNSSGRHDHEEVLLTVDAAMYSARQQWTGPRFAARLGGRAADAEGSAGASRECAPAPGVTGPPG